MMGIYKITNKTTSKIYIGSSTNVETRFYGHKLLLKNGTHSNGFLQNAWNKYGSEDFIFEIVEEVEDSRQLFPREQYYMDLYSAYRREFGYNLAICADSPTRGTVFTYEHRQKLSKSKLGTKRPIEVRLKIAEYRTGQKHRAESIQKMKIVQSGKIISKQQRENISRKLTGRKLSDSHKKRIGLSRKGIPRSEDTKNKIRNTLLGRNNGK